RNVTGVQTCALPIFARDLRVSVITTTRAYNELVADGLVDSVRGKGVFVRAQEPEEIRARALERIDEALAEAARTARTAGIGAERSEGRRVGKGCSGR